MENCFIKSNVDFAPASDWLGVVRSISNVLTKLGHAERRRTLMKQEHAVAAAKPVRPATTPTIVKEALLPCAIVIGIECLPRPLIGIPCEKERLHAEDT